MIKSGLKWMFLILMLSGGIATPVLELPAIVFVVLLMGGIWGPIAVLDHRDRIAKEIYKSLKTGSLGGVKSNQLAEFIMKLGDPRCERIIIKYLFGAELGRVNVKEFLRHPNLLPGLGTSSLPVLEAPADIPQLTSGNKENESNEQG